MKFPPPSSLARMSDDRLLAHLVTIADELDVVNQRQRELWAARINVYLEARYGRVPQITFPRLSGAARVSEVAIITKLTQLAERANAAG